MPRPYYSSRKRRHALTLEELYVKLQHLYLLFRDRDYFRGTAGITKTALPDEIRHEAGVALAFDLFPITRWAASEVTEDHIFDALEFLFDHCSKPGRRIELEWNQHDYDSYDGRAGQAEFREQANVFLPDYRSGYELTEQGSILALGEDGLRHILEAGIVPYDEENVDRKVREAFAKWRNRHLDLSEKREAIRELADVFEWLKKVGKLSAALDKKDESAIFDIANNFAIRHHNPKQKSSYDRAIWYSWIFHFYLATYHAAIRLLIKRQESEKGPALRA